MILAPRSEQNVGIKEPVPDFYWDQRAPPWSISPNAGQPVIGSMPANTPLFTYVIISFIE